MEKNKKRKINETKTLLNNIIEISNEMINKNENIEAISLLEEGSYLSFEVFGENDENVLVIIY